MIAKNYDEINWAYCLKKLAALQYDILEAYKKKDPHRIRKHDSDMAATRYYEIILSFCCIG